nr:MAG TPA: hypothetical protein [Caudoviricetes sp.]
MLSAGPDKNSLTQTLIPQTIRNGGFPVPA